MRSNILLFLFLTLGAVALNGQPADLFKQVETPDAKTGGQITIQQDDAIFKAVNDHLHKVSGRGSIPGYRIRIYSNSGSNARELVNEQKSMFLQSFPDTPVYLEYDAPFFKLYVGDYRRKYEAYQLMSQLQNKFPSAFIVSSQINLPKIAATE
ncbi:MAG: SPOR domain-containing protein [Bacteroidales bacterium]|nr:SPOR domain-containing protein [Bacteroidales bacterium]